MFGTAEQKGAVAAAAGRRRGSLVLLDDGARRVGFRPDRVADTGRSGGRGVGDQRAQVVLVRRRGHRLCDRDGGHRPRRGAASPRPRRSIVPAYSAGSGLARCRLRPPRARLDEPARSTTSACASRCRTRSASPATASESRRSGRARPDPPRDALARADAARFELLCPALEREAFGSPLAEKQTVQNWIADSAADIQACRLMTLDAAHRIDAGDEARVEISLISSSRLACRTR